MSTDLNSLCSSDDLIQRLGLSRVEFHHCNATKLIQSVWNWSREIWERVEVDHYTNHDLRHSCRIIEYFLSLNERYNWSNYEKMLFAISALIHDVGMQYNFWAGKAVGLGYGKKLSIEEVRLSHIETGSRLVLAYVSEKASNFNLVQLCDTNSSGELDAIHRSAHIAFAHSGKQFVTILCADENRTWHSRSLEGGTYRPRLLAGTLKLCDELDGSYLRIREPQYIWGWDFDDVARRHWLSCHFIESTEMGLDLDHTSDKLRSQVWKITLHWRVPERSDEAVVSQIRNFLATMREGKINQELKVINEFYAVCGEPEHHLTVMPVKGLSQPPIRFASPVHPNLIKVISDILGAPRPVVDGTAEMIKDFEHHRSLSQPPSSPAAAIDPGSVPLNRTSVEDDLRAWFESNREIGHYQLMSGEHTDMYVHCRTLVSDQNLLRRLADKLWTELKDEDIDIVLAVGTSAIPLAVNVAYRLNCAVTFTFSRDISDGSYHEIELEPNVTAGQNVLIIDDILSGGTVAKEILNRLQEHKKQPGKVFHRAVFRLGNRQYEDDRISDYSWFVHIPHARYFTSADSCDLCKQSTAIKESEIS